MNLTSTNPTAAWRATPLIRVMVGAVFFTEGIQKFLYPASRGPGRFEALGFPEPEMVAYFVGFVETACGFLLLIGFATRYAAVPTLVIMMVAIATTKIPILLGQGLGPFEVRSLPMYGFLSMTHEMRTDWSMLLGSLYLVLVGAGPLSIDATQSRRHRASPPDYTRMI